MSSRLRKCRMALAILVACATVQVFGVSSASAADSCGSWFLYSCPGAPIYPPAPASGTNPTPAEQKASFIGRITKWLMSSPTLVMGAVFSAGQLATSEWGKNTTEAFLNAHLDDATIRAWAAGGKNAMVFDEALKWLTRQTSTNASGQVIESGWGYFFQLKASVPPFDPNDAAAAKKAAAAAATVEEGFRNGLMKYIQGRLAALGLRIAAGSGGGVIVPSVMLPVLDPCLLFTGNTSMQQALGCARAFGSASVAPVQTEDLVASIYIDIPCDDENKVVARVLRSDVQAKITFNMDEDASLGEEEEDDEELVAENGSDCGEYPLDNDCPISGS